MPSSNRRASCQITTWQRFPQCVFLLSDDEPEFARTMATSAPGRHRGKHALKFLSTPCACPPPIDELPARLQPGRDFRNVFSCCRTTNPSSPVPWPPRLRVDTEENML